MKTKEIDVWVNPKRLEVEKNWRSERSISSSNWDEPDWLKAKLIIEMPEKKIEITESEFRKKTCRFVDDGFAYIEEIVNVLFRE